jgi:c-di-GMP-binding flagellar brake protein YcgR
MKAIAEQIFSNEHRLTTRKRAAAVLREICEQHERVALLPDGAERELSSILIALDEAEDWIVLDMPVPPIEPDALLAMQPLMGVVRYAGIYVGFQTDALTLIDWRGAPALKSRFPRHVYFLQRRQFYRVPVGADDVGPVALLRLGAAEVVGRCHDLSAGGMRLLAQPVLGEFPLRDGEVLASVQFTLKGVELQAQGRVQHLDEPVRRADGSVMLPIGVEFTQRSIAFEATVSRYVQARDREMLAGR